MYATAYYNRQRGLAHREKWKRSLWQLGWLASFVVAALTVYARAPRRHFPAQNLGSDVINYLGSLANAKPSDDPRRLKMLFALSASGSVSPAASASPTTLPPPPPAAATDPTWNASWITRQLPLENENINERKLTSHKFMEITAHSGTPPAAPVGELANRLIIAIGCGVHGNDGVDVSPTNLSRLHLIRTLLPSFMPTAQPHHLYRFYFAYDHDDPTYEQAAIRNAVDAAFTTAFAIENAERWHPPGYVAGTTVDASTLVMSIHWVHCDFSGKPAWAHSDAMMAAYREGADYAMRTNDDTQFPVERDWVDQFIVDLRKRVPIPNLGVVGPKCHQGATWILTHDFTHRTHAVIFGYQYPRSLPDWSSDDWITFVYEQFKLMSKRDDIAVLHTLAQSRYSQSESHVRLPALNSELKKGATTIVTWAKETHGVELKYKLIDRGCC